MKLGNQGFGLKEMIIYTCLLILLLVFVSIEINSFYKNLSNSKSNVNSQDEIFQNENIEENDENDYNITNPDNTIDYNYYEELETKLSRATQNYLNDNPYSLENEILTISSETLINLGYINTLYAQDNNSTCNGYSNVYMQEDRTYVINPFITCYNYQTSSNT